MHSASTRQPSEVVQARTTSAPYAVWPAQHHSLAHPIHKECILDVSITANVTLKVCYIHKEFILDISITDFGALAGQGAARLSLAHPTHKEFIDDSITANITRIEVGYLHKEFILDGIITANVTWIKVGQALHDSLTHPIHKEFILDVSITANVTRSRVGYIDTPILTIIPTINEHVVYGPARA